MRLALPALLVLLVAAQVRAFTPPPARAPHLREYMRLQTQRVPGAVVTSGFDDWRNPSKYRKKAGLHLGYDVAMPRGSPVVAGWAGRVTHVVQWHGAEYGVTVLSDSGYETTYGHLKPTVEPGAEVRPGDVVGTIVIDHVDIKMRGPDGLHYDFGSDRPAVAAVSRAEALRRYLRAKYSVELSEEDAERIVEAERKARKTYQRNRPALNRALDAARRKLEEARRALER